MSRLRSLHRADENRQRPHQRQQYHQEGYEEEPPHDGLMVGAVGFRIRRLISLPNQEQPLPLLSEGLEFSLDFKLNDLCVELCVH